jgi:hypothetical protein
MDPFDAEMNQVPNVVSVSWNKCSLKCKKQFFSTLMHCWLCRWTDALCLLCKDIQSIHIKVKLSVCMKAYRSVEMLPPLIFNFSTDCR